jgi:hypothetical protein
MSLNLLLLLAPMWAVDGSAIALILAASGAALMVATCVIADWINGRGR